MAPVKPEQSAPAPVKSVVSKEISIQEYSDHMSLSAAQLETVALMLQVLDQSDGGPAPTEQK